MKAIPTAACNATLTLTYVEGPASSHAVFRNGGGAPRSCRPCAVGAVRVESGNHWAWTTHEHDLEPPRRRRAAARNVGRGHQRARHRGAVGGRVRRRQRDAKRRGG